MDGTVTQRHAVRGEAVEARTKLFVVADASKLWLWINVYEQDVSQIRSGQAVRFFTASTGLEDESAGSPGRIRWVSTEVDQTTRTTKVQAELFNPEGRLRANQFGKAHIQVGAEHRALMVAKAAVERYENAEMVFLAVGNGIYRPQRIKTLPSGSTNFLEVTWGLQAGQQLVSTGAFLLKTELMKGSIGAGCCD
jgi:cobalt-zinc-cadmium efflux system membrane fusion protein